MNPDYFLGMYAADPDPWGFSWRWYEQRKYAITLAALPRDRYRSVFEPGCSVGVLSAHLAARADRLLACDLVPAAVAQTADRLRALGPGAEVEVRQWDLHDPWPEGSFDLIVLSEVLYYLEADEVRLFVRTAASHLDRDGQVVLVHWRPPVPEYPTTGDEVHGIARATPGLVCVGSYQDDDFRLDVLAHEGQRSVAALDGLH